MAARPVRRAGLVLTGMMAGLFVVALVLWLYLRLAQVGGLEREVDARLDLPPGTLQLDEISDEGPLRIRMTDLVLRGDADELIARSPGISFWFDPAGMSEEGPLELTDVRVQEPEVRLVQAPTGEWNILRALRIDGESRRADEPEEGRPIALRDIRVDGGRISIALPAEPVDPQTFAGRLNIPRASIGGRPYQVYEFVDVEARLPSVLLAGADGWEAEVSDLSASLTEPDLRIRQMQLSIASVGEDAVRFDLATLALDASRFAGAGTIRFAPAGAQYDVVLEADPLDFADLAALIPNLPTEGQARFTLATEPLGGGRTALLFRELDVDALDARASGRLGVVIGGDAPPLFRDTDLAIESLELSTLEQLGLVEDLPLTGVVAGRVSTPGEVTAETGGALAVDLTATLRPGDQPGQEPSVVRAVGGLAFGAAGEGLVLDDLRLHLEPLYLATLVPFAPEQADRLRGVARGALTVDGSLRQLRLSGGDLSYEVGDAPPTRLAGITGSVSLDPELRYEIRAEARPVALATLTELFPGLPFETATLAGPITLTGGPERIAFAADLEGAAGALNVSGGVVLGDPPFFDVSGNVRTLTPGTLIRAELPVEGAVTGTFALRGTTEDLRFEVDLEQTAGRFALAGRLTGEPDGAPRFEVAGDVTDFRIGALLGRPGLFPAPMTGALELTGGGADPFRFDVDLRGDDLVLDVAGTYAPGPVPEYTVRGDVRGLDLSRLPVGPNLPRTDLNAQIQIDGRGTTPETLAGTYFVDARGSTIGGVPLDVGLLRATAREGILFVDTLALRLDQTRLAAGGAVGLTRPAPRPLHYSFSSPDLSTLARAAAARGIAPDLAGSVQAQGWVAGTLGSPALAVVLRGRGLQYNAWRAGQVALDAEVNRRSDVGWSGEATFLGRSVTLATGETFQRLQLQVDGNQQQLGVGLFAERDDAADLTASGVVAFTDRAPTGLILESLALRLDEMEWSLAERTQIRWGGVEGLAVDDLLLQRTDDEEGSILVRGLLPPTGTADLEVRVRELDMRALGRIFTGLPEVAGILALDAVLEGPVGSPTFNVEARVDDLRYEGAAADSVAISARYGAGMMETQATVWEQERQLLAAEGRIPMLLSISDLLPDLELLRDQPLFARAEADSLDLALVTAAIPQLAEGAGVFTAEATVGGTLNRPDLAGQAALSGGAVRVIPLGVRYENITGSFALEGQRIAVESLSATSGGTGMISGTIRFREQDGPEVYLVADLSSFEVMDIEETARVEVSGRLALSGGFPRPVLTGEMTIEESTFHIPDLSQRSPVELTNVDVGQIGADTLTAGGFGPQFFADVRIDGLVVNVAESVWLVSDDARIQIAGERLVVYRTGEELRVFGVLRAERGNYSLRIGPLVREFEIVSGNVQFFGTGDLNPELDIVAANRIRTVQAGGGTTTITVLVNITGTVQFPEIRLTSDTRPPLPESEILSLLLFGRPSFALGGAAGQLAQEVLVQEALGGILFAPLEQIFLSTGLIDYVQFRSVGGELQQVGQTLGLTTVEIGTQISDDLFLTVECGVGMIFGGGGGAACGTRLHFDLGRNFTATAAYEPIRRDRLLQILTPTNILEYQWSLELRKRWEFGISDSDAGLISEPQFPAEGRPPEGGR